MRMHKVVTALAIGLVAVSVLTGCGPGEPAALSAVERKVAHGAEDRPVGDVQAASAAIDPCALLEVGLTTPASATAEPAADPFSCTLPEEDIEVSVLVGHGQDERFDQDRLVLGGAVAYRSSPQLSWCDIFLPTGFTSSIVFSQTRRASNPRDCSRVEAFAEAAAERLHDDPDSLLRPGDRRDGIIACDIFKAVVGKAPKGASFESRSLETSGLGACGLWKDPESGFKAVVPESGISMAYRDPMPQFSSKGGWEKYDVRPIAGRDTLFFTSDEANDDECILLFDAWPSAQREGKVVGAEVFARSCADAEALVAKLVPAFDDAPARDADVSSLLYGKDERDSPAPGACAHARDQAERACTPATKVEVPGSASDRISRGAVDPNVLCALARDAVRDALGEELAPVTVIDDGQLICEFVMPRHSAVVQVSASVKPLDSLVGEVKDEVAGHPAIVTKSDPDEFSRLAGIALTEPDRPGRLMIRVGAFPDRAEEPFDPAATDRGPLDQFDDIVARIAKAVFGG